MLNEIIHSLNIQEHISEDAVHLLGQRLNTARAWQVLNYLCFVQQEAPNLEEHTQRQAQIQELIFASVSEVERISWLNQHGIKVTGSELLTETQTRKNTLQFEAAQRYPKLVQEVGRYVIAQGFAHTLLESLTDSEVSNSWRDIYQQVVDTPIFSIHPLVAAELQRLIDEGLSDDEEIRRFLWVEATNQHLPTDKVEMAAAIQNYKDVLEEFSRFSPEANDYVNALGVSGDERYFHLIEMIPYMDVDSYQKFLNKCLIQGEPSFCRAFLRLTANKIGMTEVSDDDLDLIAAQYSLESVEDVQNLNNGKPYGLSFIFGEYLYRIRPTEVEPVVEGNIDLFNKGRLPNFKSPEYAALLPKLLDWAITNVEQRGRNRNIIVSPDKNAYIGNAIVDQILNGMKLYEDDFARILSPQAVGNNLEWSVGDIRIMAIVIEFENKRWGGGGIKDALRTRFILDLKELSDHL